MKFVVRRLLIAIPTLILISLLVFGLQKLLPGDSVLAISGEERDLDAIAALRAQRHLDDSTLRQYLTWLGGALRGDLGVSLRAEQPVLSLIVAKAPVTLELACMAMLLAAAAGAPLGAVAAMNRGKPVDALINLGALLGASVPHFWLGVLAILVFAVHLRWLPASGYVPFSENPVRNLQTLILPALVLGTSPAAALMRHTRDAMIGALNSDFARTARAKGLSPAAVVWKHAFRHVLTPLVTMSALWFGELLGGAVLTEQVFTIPGFGKLMVDAVFTRDYAVVQGVALCAAVGFVLLNLLADVLYAVINPRVRGS